MCPSAHTDYCWNSYQITVSDQKIFNAIDVTPTALQKVLWSVKTGITGSLAFPLQTDISLGKHI